MTPSHFDHTTPNVRSLGTSTSLELLSCVPTARLSTSSVRGSRYSPSSEQKETMWLYKMATGNALRLLNRDQMTRTPPEQPYHSRNFRTTVRALTKDEIKNMSHAQISDGFPVISDSKPAILLGH
ncbi:hypothetical protein AVEN_26011-1 [Araneus ventricosus]|uniref:Uncharacterized protein n=1 Tax=Araneus ventricosus TaxID=182803 RepID=A0A4Y2E4Q4_ARAVE|nr:hypothetical protein AVEN_26011-1 [Araneus ventricosus]